jgi:hypothetical protein
VCGGGGARGGGGGGWLKMTGEGGSPGKARCQTRGLPTEEAVGSICSKGVWGAAQPDAHPRGHKT